MIFSAIWQKSCKILSFVVFGKTMHRIENSSERCVQRKMSLISPRLNLPSDAK